MPVGVYVSVPFCRTKCSFCNFASNVFSRAVFDRYVDRVCEDIERAPRLASELNANFDRSVDTIYLGGGTPTVLYGTQLRRIFLALRHAFDVAPGAEITVECAPGTATQEVLEELLECGVNRVSLGVQSFVDQEAASVGRLHNKSIVLDDIFRLREAGITNVGVDLIAGLPHQTRDSWQFSVDQTVGCGVSHVSVYMLEVDDESRLGRELIAGGTKYHAHFVPDDDLTAEFYEAACERLNAAGVRQYEISNFAREDFESRHNLKYWTRKPYLGFGVDAHSMLPNTTGDGAVRFSTPDSLENYVAAKPVESVLVTRSAALEEAFFLGLRLNRGVSLRLLESDFGAAAVSSFSEAIGDAVEDGLLEERGDSIVLTGRGRMLSNEVFERFIRVPAGER